MAPRNHAACVGSYCDAILSGEIIAGRYVELAVRRYLDDIDHAHERGLHFDADIAEKSLQFVETVCTHQKAEWAGQPFKLSPNQQFILWNLTGWRRENGCRRFRRAYITAGRKWGKSLFASAIMKLLTLYDTPLEPGAEVYSIATAEDQARLVYDAFLSMVEFSPSKRIRDAAKIRTKRCSFPGEKYRDSIVRPLGSERNTRSKSALMAASGSSANSASDRNTMPLSRLGWHVTPSRESRDRTPRLLPAWADEATERPLRHRPAQSRSPAAVQTRFR